MAAVDATARVTVVMTARERHGLASHAIERLVACTPQPFRFVYLDVQSPPNVASALRDWAEAGRIELHRFDEALWPQEVRRRFAPSIDTEFAVFIDNDVEVSPGWLESLLRCADETGAGIVGPLYLWSDGRRAPTIHMAGGKLVETVEPDGRVLDETHEHLNADGATLLPKLVRRSCDFAEFHCMLIHRRLIDDGRLFDPSIRCVHEHIDVAMSACARGETVWFEPAAQVTYLAFHPFTLGDLRMLRDRWSSEAGEASIAAFSAKWSVKDDPRSFWGVRTFLAQHVARLDAIRPRSRDNADHAVAMTRAALCQSRSDLLDLAIRRGYEAEELRALSEGYARAQMLSNAGYRPCGRPFISHLVGTAGVLLRYGFRIETVVAGLLHASYTHCPAVGAGPAEAAAQVAQMLGGSGHPVERRVRAYTLRTANAFDADDVGRLTIFDAEILAIEAANEIDMWLSGEVRYSGRSDTLGERTCARVRDVCAALGVPGLAATLDDAVADPGETAVIPVTGMRASYRIGGRVPGPLPMVSDVPRVLAP